MKKPILVGTGLIGSLAFPSYVFGSSIREILERKPEDVLLAMMIYGETSGCIPLEKLFAGFTPFNRIEAGKSYFGTTSLKNVLLYPKAYNCFDDSEKNKKNLTRILSPNKKDKEWIESVMITKGILRRDWTNYNQGQTHFYNKKLKKLLEQKKLGINPNKLKPIDSKGFKHQFYREI